ncbi:tetratricopeptide repeat protein [Nitratifractor sp.]
MEEITTRFEIIRLAVKLGDFRAIDLQCEKLRSLSLDEKLNEIIDLLESRNYRQALYEMKHYAKTLEDDFFETPTSSRPLKGSERRETPPKDLGLFGLEETEEEEEEEERVLDLEDILRLSRQRETPATREYSPAPEFGLESQESAPIEENPEKRSSAHARVPEAMENETHETPEHVTEADEPVTDEAITTPEESPSDELLGVDVQEGEDTLEEEERSFSSAASVEVKEPDEETVEHNNVVDTSEEEPIRYTPISYISQKFRNMIHQFPPVDNEGRIPVEVEQMQKKISTEGYTEEEIEAFLGKYQEYKEEGKKFEAAMVLLLAAATESKFAQFLLARELFRGEIIEQDHAEAFTQINTLADQNFAEAICDLGQFYEHGIGIGKDRQMALLLYEEAAEMGIARARKHYERLKSSRGLLGVFKKVSLPNVAIPLPKKKDNMQ